MNNTQATRMWRPWPTPKLSASPVNAPTALLASPLHQAVIAYLTYELN